MNQEFTNRYQLPDELRPEQEDSDRDDETSKLLQKLLKSMEIQAELLSNELHAKNINIQTILERVKEHARVTDNQREGINYEDIVILQLQHFIEVLNQKSEELEARNKELLGQIDRHLMAIEKLELENDFLKAENLRFVMEIKQRGRPHSIRKLDNDQRSPRRSLSLREPEFSTQSSIIFDHLKSPENDYRSEVTDDSQFEYLKEQLESERLIVKDMEILIGNLQSSNQHLASENFKLYDQNKGLEAKIEQITKYYEKINETRLQERLKIDSLITFCNLLENGNCQREEIAHQLTELPIFIINYLRGDPRAVDLGRLPSQCTNRIRPRGDMREKKMHEQNGQSLDIQAVYRSMRDVKDVISQILEAINQKERKKLRLTDHIALRSIENFAEDFSDKDRPYSRQRQLAKTDRFYLSKAVSCAHSFFLHIKQGTAAGTVSQEEDYDDDGNLTDESNFSE